jgi:hypothetical protein
VDSDEVVHGEAAQQSHPRVQGRGRPAGHIVLAAEDRLVHAVGSLRPQTGVDLRTVQRQPLGHPYYQERLAALRSWVASGGYRVVLDRPHDAPDRLIEIVLIRAFELAAEGDTVDPYVIVTDGDSQVLRTNYASAVREAEWTGFKPSDRGVDQPCGFRDGQPLFFEVWDKNDFGDTFVGGFVVYAAAGDAVAAASVERRPEDTAKILWDWKEPRAVARPGHATVVVRFSERVVPGGGVVKEGRR